ncbi:hypothetical protein LTR09_012153 [Extremus antarcticus]|uniref:Aflatoxin regulatory protein domain-containing protein n=1 Tax=Extremus antarcticus TaxID=702011 RepID=A0AAJ0DAV4_9PEZI|nr:hypothetical protein LTR09_012153 [Extremus antarcticus]
MGSSSTADAMMDAFTNEEWFPRGAPWPEQSPSELASSSIAFWTDLESTVEIDHAEANSLFGSVSDNSLTNNVPAILDLDMTADDAAIWTKPSGHDAMHTESTPVAPVAVMLPASGMSSTNNSGPETRDSCLMTATQLMLSLFPRSCSGSDVSLPLEMVLQQNRRAIDEATAIMDCQCVKDGYLASILSLTLLKTMAWYSAAVGGIRSGSICQPGSAGVRNIRCGSISNETVRRDAIDHESESQEDRSAAQQVMGELHHVQRLLKLMSNLLGNQGLQQGFSDSGFGSSKSSTGSWEGEQSSIGTSQLSQSMFNSLDEEIRGRFRAVSRATIERLRII